MIYDLAYINIPSITVKTNAEFQTELGKLKAGLATKDGLLCPNKVIQTVHEAVCHADMLCMREFTLRALDDVIEYCVAKQCADKAYPDNIENLILSRLYEYAVKESGNYSWHILCSEIHDSSQASIKDLHTNHDILLNDAANQKDP